MSRKLKFIPLSTCEAEVAAIVMMIKEALFVLAILRDMHAVMGTKIPVVTDSKSAIDVIKNPGATKHTTHWERWLQWARRLYLLGQISMHLVGTDDMMADDKTKAVERTKLIKCRGFQLNGTMSCDDSSGKA